MTALSPPPLAADLNQGLKRLKMAAMRQIAPELLWQLFTWRASGARLHVSYTGGMPLGTDYPATVVLRGIKVTNRGRAATSVSGVTSRLPCGAHLPLIEDALRQVSFPTEIKPGESVTAYYGPEAVEKALLDQGLPSTTRLTPEAICGHGDVRGKSVRAG